ncbi:MAG: c-type cytochrome [Sphingobacteriales bacterium]|nr:c-type cytochrome [Sphingobacteriales bacterium]
MSLSLTSNVFGAVAVPDVNPTDAAAVDKAKQGMELYKANCTACHAIDRKLVGPALTGVWDRWESEAKIVAWVQNSSKLIASGDPYSNKIFSEYNKSVMQAFPQLSAEQIMNILVYVKAKSAGVALPFEAPPAGPSSSAGNTATAANEGTATWYIWALLAFLIVLSALLWSVSAKLDKVVREKKGEVVEDVPFSKKLFSRKTFKVLLLIASILLVFNIFNGAIDLGRSQGYAPDQPIKFSHALHVGQNKIDCQYCHTGVEKSRHASIPGTQICMNCHKYVQQGPKYGKDEIAKIYDFAGWDADKQKIC